MEATVFSSRVVSGSTTTYLSIMTPALRWQFSPSTTESQTKAFVRVQPAFITTLSQIILFSRETPSPILQFLPMTERLIDVLASRILPAPMTVLSEIEDETCLLTSLLIYLLKWSTLKLPWKTGKSTVRGWILREIMSFVIT